jgi:hypothetical protein
MIHRFQENRNLIGLQPEHLIACYRSVICYLDSAGQDTPVYCIQVIQTSSGTYAKESLFGQEGQTVYRRCIVNKEDKPETVFFFTFLPQRQAQILLNVRRLKVKAPDQTEYQLLFKPKDGQRLTPEDYQAIEMVRNDCNVLDGY